MAATFSIRPSSRCVNGTILSTTKRRDLIGLFWLNATLLPTNIASKTSRTRSWTSSRTSYNTDQSTHPAFKNWRKLDWQSAHCESFCYRRWRVSSPMMLPGALVAEWTPSISNYYLWTRLTQKLWYITASQSSRSREGLFLHVMEMLVIGISMRPARSAQISNCMYSAKISRQESDSRILKALSEGRSTAITFFQVLLGFSQIMMVLQFYASVQPIFNQKPPLSLTTSLIRLSIEQLPSTRSKIIRLLSTAVAIQLNSFKTNLSSLKPWHSSATSTGKLRSESSSSS